MARCRYYLSIWEWPDTSTCRHSLRLDKQGNFLKVGGRTRGFLLDINLLDGNNSFNPPPVGLNMLDLRFYVSLFHISIDQMKKKCVENIKTQDDSYNRKTLLSFSKAKCTNLIGLLSYLHKKFTFLII